MNRLRGAACYLCGPMEKTADNGCGWRNGLAPLLKDMGVVVFDPCNKHIEVSDESAETRDAMNRFREQGLLNTYRDWMKGIRRVDLRCIDLASFVIVRLDGTPTVGTWEEIAMGVSEQKPVLIWLDGSLNKANVNGWLLAQVPLGHIFESQQELVNYLRNIDSSVSHPRDRRWILWDFAAMYSEVLNGRSTECVTSTDN